MSTYSDTHASTREADEASREHEYLMYRSVSAMSVVALILAIVSVASIFFVGLAFLPVLGLVVGGLGWRTVRQHPNEKTGAGLALTAIVICAVSLTASVSWATWIYITEVPDGYQRVTFLELQPDKEHPEMPVPPKALEMDGERVFVKGYIYPDDRGAEVRQFVLVPDMGTCCFGGQPKLTDMIEVTLNTPLTTGYSMIQKRLGGVLRVDTTLKPISGLNGVYYQLEADYLDGDFAQ